jgi:SP family sugar:H+ symporter-like MFS transporter
LRPTADPNRVEAPVTVKAYLLCVFASFGGIYFGYDTGWIGGVLGECVFPTACHSSDPSAMPYFINQITGLPYPPETPANLFVIPAWQQSLMSSILSAGTFFGAIMAGE